MKYCYGTFQAVMDMIKRLTEVWKLRDLIAHPLDPEYFIGDRSEQNKLSDLARGENDLPGIMVENAWNKDPNGIAVYFRDKVLNCLRSEMFQLAILVLKDIIKKDSIDADEIVEVVSGMTKREFLDCKAFMPYKTFAGLFMAPSAPRWTIGRRVYCWKNSIIMLFVGSVTWIEKSGL